MTTIRLLISVFVAVLIVLSTAGWLWTNSHQPPAQAAASHLVLAASMLAGVGCLIVLWRS